MSKFLRIFIIIIALGLIGSIFYAKFQKPSEPLIGVHHDDQGQQHIQRGQPHGPYNSDPGSSGPHYNDSSAPTDWGVYTQIVPDEVFIHNEEHGGIVVTYNPKLLPADQLTRLQHLFAPPYSNTNFEPLRAVVTPRPNDTHPIELAAWQWTMNLDQYDETTLIKFYNQHINHAPENGAEPTNTPINQAAN